MMGDIPDKNQFLTLDDFLHDFGVQAIDQKDELLIYKHTAHIVQKWYSLSDFSNLLANFIVREILRAGGEFDRLKYGPDYQTGWVERENQLLEAISRLDIK